LFLAALQFENSNNNNIRHNWHKHENTGPGGVKKERVVANTWDTAGGVVSGYCVNR
jgi:hypothetical protein